MNKSYQTFNFPIAFPNEALNLTFGMNDYEGIPRGGHLTKTTFSMWPSRNKQSSFFYLAIGW